MRYWDDKDANGNKLTDGRVCLVITSDENPDMPEIRTYGKDREEVLDKLAKTTETAQSTIHRMRKAPPAVVPAATPAAATTTGTDVALAVADLSNPAKAGAAIKTLLKSVGVDVDRQQMERKLRLVADLAEAWERERPDYPKDPRNDQILMNRATNLAGGTHLIRSQHLDAAFEELRQKEMLFEPKVTVQPGGNPDSRTVRTATSYRRNSLRSAEPSAAPRETAKEAEWRNILENGTGKALEDAIRFTPGFREWVDKAVQVQKTA